MSKKIAIMGTRGIPASYGGFETFAEELSKRLVSNGHEVTVYARKRFFESDPELREYLGVKILYAPTIMHKYLETPVHALTSFLKALFYSYETIILCNAANSPFSWILKLKKSKLLINVDGVERKRAKWNSLGRLWYRLGEQCSAWFADVVIADAEVISQYYQNSYGVKSKVIRYGAQETYIKPGATLEKFNLKEKQFLLYVSRLEPENNALGVIKAYVQLKTDMPLVIVGDAPYAQAYKEQLRLAANERVIFTGFQFGEAYRELRSNCYLYIQASEVGGTHPALVEAMAHGNCVVANRVPEHEEVLLDAGVYYEKNDFGGLGKILEELLLDSARVKDLGERAKVIARDKYTWERITEEYEEIIF